MKENTFIYGKHDAKSYEMLENVSQQRKTAIAQHYAAIVCEAEPLGSFLATAGADIMMLPGASKYVHCYHTEPVQCSGISG